MKGYIRKLGADIWQLIYELPRDADGKRRQAIHTVHGKKRDAETKLRALIAVAESGDHIAPTKETVGGFLATWLDTYSHVLPGLREDRSRTVLKVAGKPRKEIEAQNCLSTLGLRVAHVRYDRIQSL
jgi:hypothetical protein